MNNYTLFALYFYHDFKSNHLSNKICYDIVMNSHIMYETDEAFDDTVIEMAESFRERYVKMKNDVNDPDVLMALSGINDFFRKSINPKDLLQTTPNQELLVNILSAYCKHLFIQDVFSEMENNSNVKLFVGYGLIYWFMNIRNEFD